MYRTMRWLPATCCLLLLLSVAGPLRAEDPVVYQSDFAKEGTSGWKMTDPQAWQIIETDKGKGLALVAKSKYEPKVRSPFNYALVDGLALDDFVMDVDVKSTARDYGHRDLCFFFGHQDPEHFYYVHLGKQADPHAHSIFLVNNEPRLSIAKERTDGTPWTDDWHHVRIVRSSDAGAIKVYFDDMEKPVMTTVDKTFPWGKVGVGSFDDTGIFANLVIKGKRHDASTK